MIISSPLMIAFSRTSEPIKHGAIAIERGSILEIGAQDDIIRKYPRHPLHFIPDAVIMPGLINAHTHLELPQMVRPHRAEDYVQWVLRLLRAKSRLTQKDLRNAVLENVATMKKCGTTTVAEICTHRISPNILRKSGMRTVLYFEVISMNPTVRKKALPAFPSRRSNLVHFGLSPHSPHTVSEEILIRVRDKARRYALPLCMHIAETADEQMLLRGRPGSLDVLYHAAGWQRSWAPAANSAFRYLERKQILDKRFLAVHAVHVDDADIRILKRTGSGVVHCPRSNKIIQVGKMRLAPFLRAGIPVGLGTDSLASVPSLNLWDEMRYAYRIHRPSGISAMDIITMATIGGARALSMDREVGSLEPGKKADIIAVPLPKRNTGRLAADLLRETKSSIMTMVNGKIIYQQQHTNRR